MVAQPAVVWLWWVGSCVVVLPRGWRQDGVVRCSCVGWSFSQCWSRAWWPHLRRPHPQLSAGPVTSTAAAGAVGTSAVTAAKPRATVAGNAQPLGSGKVRVSVTSNAKKVKVAYRTVEEQEAHRDDHDPQGQGRPHPGPGVQVDPGPGQGHHEAEGQRLDHRRWGRRGTAGCGGGHLHGGPGFGDPAADVRVLDGEPVHPALLPDPLLHAPVRVRRWRHPDPRPGPV